MSKGRMGGLWVPPEDNLNSDTQKDPPGAGGRKKERKQAAQNLFRHETRE